jgi:hypothetical protein
MLFDASTGAMTELDPQTPRTARFGVVIGGDTVAFTEFGNPDAEILAHDLAAGTTRNLSQSPELDMHPSVSGLPAGVSQACYSLA